MVVCNGDCEHLDGIPAFADIATLLDDVSCITDGEHVVLFIMAHHHEHFLESDL